MLERHYQAKLIKKLRVMFEGCVVLKNDSGYMQGVPDLSIFYKDMWAMLEVKSKAPEKPEDFEPNQEWHLERFNVLSFAACVFPENEKEVLNALQRSFASGRPARLPERKQAPLGTIFRGEVGSNVS